MNFITKPEIGVEESGGNCNDAAKCDDESSFGAPLHRNPVPLTTQALGGGEIVASLCAGFYLAWLGRLLNCYSLPLSSAVYYMFLTIPQAEN